MSDLSYKGQVEMAFDYKTSEGGEAERIPINSQRITYVMIERMYENVRILPVIYVGINVNSELYGKIVDSYEFSKFYMEIRKGNAKSGNSVFKTVVKGTFSYVSSTTQPNYGEDLATTQHDIDDAYKHITLGLVDSDMTNLLRKPFNGIYNNINQEKLIKEVALKDIEPLIMEEIKYNKEIERILIPPLSTRYRLLEYIFDIDPYYDSYFTFFMDFDKTYFLSRNSEPVDGKDGEPTNVMLYIKEYTGDGAFSDGFTQENGAYVAYINAADTNVVVNTSTEKITNNLVAYSDETGIQDLKLDMNLTSASEVNKISYIRSDDAAAIKNEMFSNSTTVEILKQNLDPDIFTPNKVYNITHYGSYAKFDGPYYLFYKREMYYVNPQAEFMITCNVGFKMCGTEEKAKATHDTYVPSIRSGVLNPKAKKSNSSKKNGSSKPASNARRTTPNSYNGYK